MTEIRCTECLVSNSSLFLTLFAPLVVSAPCELKSLSSPSLFQSVCSVCHKSLVPVPVCVAVSVLFLMFPALHWFVLDLDFCLFDTLCLFLCFCFFASCFLYFGYQPLFSYPPAHVYWLWAPFGLTTRAWPNEHVVHGGSNCPNFTNGILIICIKFYFCFSCIFFLV